MKNTQEKTHMKQTQEKHIGTQHRKTTQEKHIGNTHMNKHYEKTQDNNIGTNI